MPLAWRYEQNTIEKWTKRYISSTQNGDHRIPKNRGIPLIAITATVYNALLLNIIKLEIEKIHRKYQNGFWEYRSTTSYFDFMPNHQKSTCKKSRDNSKACRFLLKHLIQWNLKSFEGQGLRARLCCRKISDSIFWLHCFTPRWLAGAIPCPKKVPKEIYKKKR